MKIRVEVVYALADAQTVIELELEQGARVSDALVASCLQGLLSQALRAPSHVGIWGMPASQDTELRGGDRVEIYRELSADPKQARRQRAGRRRGANARD